MFHKDMQNQAGFQDDENDLDDEDIQELLAEFEYDKNLFRKESQTKFNDGEKNQVDTNESTRHFNIESFASSQDEKAVQLPLQFEYNKKLSIDSRKYSSQNTEIDNTEKNNYNKLDGEIESESTTPIQELHTEQVPFRFEFYKDSFKDYEIKDEKCQCNKDTNKNDNSVPITHQELKSTEAIEISDSDGTNKPDKYDNDKDPFREFLSKCCKSGNQPTDKDDYIKPLTNLDLLPAVVTDNFIAEPSLPFKKQCDTNHSSCSGSEIKETGNIGKDNCSESVENVRLEPLKVSEGYVTSQMLSSEIQSDNKEISSEKNTDLNKIKPLEITEIEKIVQESDINEPSTDIFEHVHGADPQETIFENVDIPIKITTEEDDRNKEENMKKGSVKIERNNETEEVKLGKEKVSIQETASRPQNLPLKEVDTEKQMEINLVGDPGSTPYNNIYVSKEISKPQEQDTESISSTSSNTFSDTGSTASTASTEEIKDDIAIISTTSAQQPNTLNTNMTENPEASRIVQSDNESNGRNLEEEMCDHSETNIGQSTMHSGEGEISSGINERQWLGKEPPLWIPDGDATSCLHCDMKFTVLKRRHHCRACGLVLCSKCCYIRFKLEYLEAEARVCNKCHDFLNKDTNSSSSSNQSSPDPGNSPLRRLNPNNPLDYCSTVPPLQQVSGTSQTPIPAVMVPVGVLKRKGSNKVKSNKSVMFCDGIRPGSDLTNLDNDFNYNNTKTKKLEKTSTTASAGKINRNLPLIDSDTNSFIPKNENSLPPLITLTKTNISYTDCMNNLATVALLKNNQLSFAILLSLYVHVKVINMNCCINKLAWCFSTEGLINVGQDEIVIILEYIEDESFVPKDMFYHINNIYAEAVKGTSIKELGISLHNSQSFLGSKNHVGFVYIRPTFQCLENIIKPKEPFLIGILIHRWETPWAKLFPLRLILRLGAESRYYPSPVISTRHRDSVFVEIGHTIINLLADFRNCSYTLPQINGLTIHMEDKNTTVTIPINRYDQVIKSLNNSSDHILAFGGSFSQTADSHLVCIQDTQGNENCYSTHAINIQNKPRNVTGASFIVFNGALKSSSGLTAKSNIVEDGLMIQVLPEHMQQIRENLKAMKNHTILCGCVNATTDETVSIIWGENDTNFNIGVTSPIDGMALSGIPSIRVHNGRNHFGANGNRIIRWTEVFIIQNRDDNPKNQDPVDVSRISENIAKATCDALLNYLDLLVTNNCQKIGIRTSLHVDSVSYCAGSNNTKLPPIYMKTLDNDVLEVSNVQMNGFDLQNTICRYKIQPNK